MARYRILMSVEIEEPGDLQAYQTALKLEELMKQPIVRMSLEGAGVRLVGDGRLVVHQPQRSG